MRGAPMPGERDPPLVERARPTRRPPACPREEAARLTRAAPFELARSRASDASPLIAADIVGAGMGRASEEFLCPFCDNRIGMSARSGPDWTLVNVPNKPGWATLVMSCPSCRKAFAAYNYEAPRQT